MRFKPTCIDQEHSAASSPPSGIGVRHPPGVVFLFQNHRVNLTPHAIFHAGGFCRPQFRGHIPYPL